MTVSHMVLNRCWTWSPRQPNKDGCMSNDSCELAITTNPVWYHDFYKLVIPAAWPGIWNNCQTLLPIEKLALLLQTSSLGPPEMAWLICCRSLTETSCTGCHENPVNNILNRLIWNWHDCTQLHCQLQIASYAVADEPMHKHLGSKHASSSVHEDDSIWSYKNHQTMGIDGRQHWAVEQLTTADTLFIIWHLDSLINRESTWQNLDIASLTFTSKKPFNLGWTPKQVHLEVPPAASPLSLFLSHQCHLLNLTILGPGPLPLHFLWKVLYVFWLKFARPSEQVPANPTQAQPYE